MVASILVEPTEIAPDAAVGVFAALAEPARLRILAVLADASQCVCDIHEHVPIAPNLLSYHLRVLREVGLITGSRRGRWIDYRLATDAGALVEAALRTAGFTAVIEQPAGCATTCDEP